jgi:hypothetical protein
LKKDAFGFTKWSQGAVALLLTDEVAGDRVSMVAE